MRFASAYFVLLGLVLTSGARLRAQFLPTFVPVEERLAEEIRKILDAGHLAPGISTFEQHFRNDAPNRLGWKPDDYWHNPAELVYTLTQALPHLPEPLRSQTRVYLQSEFQLYPPTDLIHTGPEGARREYFDVPPEYAADWPVRYGQMTEAQTTAHWPGWSFNPFNIYACAKYAEAFPSQTSNILNTLRSKVAPLPTDAEFLRTHPHVLNVYIAGYFGYLSLQRMAGEAESAQVRSWLNDALAMRVALLQEGTAHLNGSEAGGFLWLTPELGDYLYENAADFVQQAVGEYDWAAPYWFVSNAQETTRFWSEREFMEGYHAHVYDTMSQFQARAFALKYPRHELERLLDTSSVARGDLYYIQNLIATLAAGDRPVWPAAGEGATQTFTFTFSDPNGWQDLDVVNVMVSFWLDGRNSCYIAYSRPSNAIYLVDDAGANLSQPLAPGSPGNVANSQCTVFGAESSVNGSGNTLTLTLKIGFSPSYAGTKVIHLAARDGSGNNSGWQRLGVWTAPAASQPSPAVVGMNPSRGGGAGPTTFTIEFSDQNGWQHLGVLNVLVNDWLDGRNACYLAYSRPANLLYLVGDAGGGLLPPLALGGGSSVGNSQCTIHGASSSVSGSGNTLTLTLSISFSGAFSGNRVFYVAARDIAENNSGWQALGSWTLP